MDKDFDQRDAEQQYRILLQKYIEKWNEVRKAEQSGKGTEYVLFVDNERNELHKKLILIGDKISKSRSDVAMDILCADGSLKEYRLPEFAVTNLRDYFYRGGGRSDEIERTHGIRHGLWTRKQVAAFHPKEIEYLSAETSLLLGKGFIPLTFQDLRDKLLFIPFEAVGIGYHPLPGGSADYYRPQNILKDSGALITPPRLYKRKALM